MQCVLLTAGRALLRPAWPAAAAGLRTSTAAGLRTSTAVGVRTSTAAGLRTSAAGLRTSSETSGQSLQLRPISKDRRNPVPVETSIAYLQSEAYRATYGDQPVWRSYRRNHKGHIPPRKTRRTCVRGGEVSTGNPCPVCRDEYLVLDYRNTALLKQFVSDFNGAVLDFSRTGLCQVKHRELLAAMHKAKEYGTISFDVPFRVYDYDEYRPK
ncbi:28S ribosomal protein S18b, mitochondrial-like [Pollicipes pollicipes]|uniref:28S ribosomal protein S18b, mitochondrial-like n=1 Tax=Pollicipes pollicipes TaxID=41117 RepID=UPI001884CB8F|nr:28S ribosomal protein S18b, mitochondrial-like [Pollicipes pollicipes]